MNDHGRGETNGLYSLTNLVTGIEDGGIIPQSSMKMSEETTIEMAAMVEKLVNAAVDNKLKSLSMQQLESKPSDLDDDSLVERTESKTKIISTNTPETDIRISIKDDVFEMDFGNGEVMTGKPSNLTINFRNEHLESTNQQEESEVIDIVVEEPTGLSETDSKTAEPVFSLHDKESGVVLLAEEPAKRDGFLSSPEFENDALKDSERVKRHAFRRRRRYYRVTRRSSFRGRRCYNKSFGRCHARRYRYRYY